MKSATAPGSIARLIIGLGFAAVLATTIGIRAAGAAFVGHDLPAVAISGADTFELAGLMPGDVRDAAIVRVEASNAVTYRINVEWTGSAQLAREIVLTLTDAAGTVLYRGPLAEARIGGSGWSSALDRTLAEGGSDSIAVAAQLPLQAGNEIQGAAVTARLVLEVSESFE